MTQRFKIIVTIEPLNEQGKSNKKRRLTLKNFKGRTKFGSPTLTKPKDHPHSKSFVVDYSDPRNVFDPSELER